MPTSLLWFRRDCLVALQESLDGALVIRSGDPAVVLPALVRETGATTVHVSADAGPYGRRRDTTVERALGTVPLVRTGSPYAVTPGRVMESDGSPFTVLSPFACAWRAHGWRAPAPRPSAARWLTGMPARPARGVRARAVAGPRWRAGGLFRAGRRTCGGAAGRTRPLPAGPVRVTAPGTPRTAGA